MHPSCGGRSILFEYRAADWNPALALRMRAMGVAPRGAMMRSGQQMQRLGRVWLAQSAGWRVHIAGVVRQWFLRIWWRFFASVQGVLRGAKPLSCFRFEGMHAKTDEPRRVFLLCGFCCLGAQARGKTRKTSNGRKAACSKSYCALRLKPIRIWISMVSEIASSRRGTSF